MPDRERKEALFAQFAAVGKVLGHPGRLELLDLLAQAPHSVEDLASAAGLRVSTCSGHLQALHDAGLVRRRRSGKRVHYSLAGDDVAQLWESVRRVAERHRPLTAVAGRAYLGPEEAEPVGTEELLTRVTDPRTVVVDVRPEPEFTAGHLEGALNIPLPELEHRVGELRGHREVVVYCRGRYCALAHEAVRLLRARGISARRAAEGALEWRADGRPLTAS